MKRFIVMALVVWGACLSGYANLYTYTFGDINTPILDNDGGGITDTRVLSGMGGDPGATITDVNVTLHINGGFNGDLYGYLVHDGGFAILLNRVGRTDANEFGSAGSGFNITLDDQGGTDIHLASVGNGAVLNNTWAVDGRNIDPNNTLNTDSRTALLNSFNGVGANGSWTLFLADASAGGEASLVSWGLEISTVPEPAEWALIIFGSVAALVRLVLPRWRQARALQPVRVSCRD